MAGDLSAEVNYYRYLIRAGNIPEILQPFINHMALIRGGRRRL